MALVMSMAMPFKALDLVPVQQFEPFGDKASLMNETYFDLSSGSFSQNWSNVGLITVNDNWGSVPSIQGFLGQDITTTTGVDPQTLVGVSAVANDIDAIANQANPNTLASGGVAEFEITDPVVALQGSGTADAPHVIFYVNTTGRQSVNVSYNLRDVDGSADNSIQPVALQYRVGNTGDFVNVPAGFVADASSGPSLATLVTPVSVTLPAAVNNQPQVQIRVMTTNAVGSDEWIGVDDIVVSSSSAGGNPGSVQLSNATYTVTEGTPTLTVTATRTGGSDGAVGVSYATANGSATSGTCGGGPTADYTAASGTLSWATGDAAAKTFDITLCDDTQFEGNETFNVTLSSATGGATLGSPSSAVVTINETDPQPATISLSSASLSQEESQSAQITVLRSGDTSGVSTVGLSTSSALTANGAPLCAFGADFVSQNSVVTFQPGETSQLYSIPICGDAFPESTETFDVVISNPTGAVLGSTSVASVTITDTASQYRNPAAMVFSGGAQTSSTINVGGQAGPVGTIRVTLYDLNSTNPANIDVLLVGPDGRQILLMSNAGGFSTSTKSITFSDSAGQVLPQSAPIVTGTYEPTSWVPGQRNFNPPAPAGPYNEPGNTVGGGPNLTSVFGGASANGTWTLYVRDDNGVPLNDNGDTSDLGISGGSIAGWGIEFISQPGSAAALSGQVIDINRRGISSAYVQLSGGNLPQPVIVPTNSLGRFRFTGLQAGQVYTLQTISRRHNPWPATASFTLNSSLNDVTILALEQ